MRVRVSFYILLLIFNLVLSIQTFPQIIISEKIQFNKIAGDQNVALNFIWCVFQDTKGFIWIGASEGLIRYDGLRFKSYKYSTNDTNSISANTVRVILEDKSGYLWIGTGGGGLNRYNPSKDNFTAYFS
jgi:ligand-binding sensor domain-containing protein